MAPLLGMTPGYAAAVHNEPGRAAAVDAVEITQNGANPKVMLPPNETFFWIC